MSAYPHVGFPQDGASAVSAAPAICLGLCRAEPSPDKWAAADLQTAEAAQPRTQPQSRRQLRPAPQLLSAGEALPRVRSHSSTPAAAASLLWSGQCLCLQKFPGLARYWLCSSVYALAVSRSKSEPCMCVCHCISLYNCLHCLHRCSSPAQIFSIREQCTFRCT